MYNISSLYQSPIRQYINEHIYHKPVIYIDIQDQKYQCIIHNKKIWPINIYRAQILWINSSKIQSDNISNIKNQITSQTKWICIYIQFGISSKPSENNLPNDLQKSLRENMPSGSTYIYTQNSIDDIYTQVSKSHKAHIKKAISRWLTFDIWDQEDSLTFYQIRKDTAWTKWFGVPSQKKFDDLIKYIYENNCGKIFLTKLDGQIIGWAVCLFMDLDGYRTCIYLYGMTDRNAGNIGTNQFLHREIIKRCNANLYDIYDFLWISGINDDETHHLSWVTKFKLWFGWQADYIIWGMDLITNKYIYPIYKLTTK